MNKVTLSLIVVLLISLLAAPPVLATPPDDASGEVIVYYRDDTTAKFTITGTFEGDGIEYYGQGKSSRVVCDCTVDGKKGTVVFSLVQLNYTTFTGYFTSLYATGELEGLHFHGKYEPNDTGVSYWGKIHFEP